MVTRQTVFVIFICFLFRVGFSQGNIQTISWKNINSVIWVSDTVLINQEYKDSLRIHDFSPIWTRQGNSYTYGIIGGNFQRLKVKIIKVTKDTSDPDIYHIYGKSMVRTNLCEFKGTMKITSIRVFENYHYGIDNDYKRKINPQGIIIGEYELAEDSTLPHSGIFKGHFATLWHLDNSNKIVYDDIEKESDRYRNNQFVGTWTGYKPEVKKICNWGDFRVPFSNGLDMGAGDFSPSDEYLKFGWQNLRDAINNDEQAIKEELREWWK